MENKPKDAARGAAKLPPRVEVSWTPGTSFRSIGPSAEGKFSYDTAPPFIRVAPDESTATVLVKDILSPGTGPSAAEPMLKETIRAWQPYVERELTLEDARQMAENMVGVFRLLIEWENHERSVQEKRG